MINYEELRDDDCGEIFEALAPEEKKEREVLLACMPLVFMWDDGPLEEYKKIVKANYSLDKSFFKEALSNGENDSSPLLMADESVYTDEEILFLAMEADEQMGRFASAFHIFSTPEQKKDKDLVARILEKYPDAEEFLDE